MPVQTDRGVINGEPTPVPVPPPTSQSAQNGVLELTNQYRAANGVAPLTLQPQLATAAQAFAQLMNDLVFFDHTSPDGTTVGQRLAAAGYNWRTYGENIAWGYRTPEDVMSGWIGSAGHRTNLLNAAFTEVGIGYVSGTSPYWVQDFGTR